MVFANTAGSKHLNIDPEKNETDENFVFDQKLPWNKARSDYFNQVNAIKGIYVPRVIFKINIYQ